jgi:hypothetical protein
VRRPLGSVIGTASVVALLWSPFSAQEPAGSTSWLDRTLAGWNRTGAVLPKAPPGTESRDNLVKRCMLTLRQSTPAERLLTDAGWLAYPHFDRQLVQGDVEILDGMSAADPACRPLAFNSFVFVGGRFAGTLSPGPMATERDGSAGSLRILPGDVITADFSRYRTEDAGCCPSAHMVVRFKVDRSGSAPVVVPVDIRQTR